MQSKVYRQIKPEINVPICLVLLNPNGYGTTNLSIYGWERDNTLSLGVTRKWIINNFKIDACKGYVFTPLTQSAIKWLNNTPNLVCEAYKPLPPDGPKTWGTQRGGVLQ